MVPTFREGVFLPLTLRTHLVLCVNLSLLLITMARSNAAKKKARREALRLAEGQTPPPENKTKKEDHKDDETVWKEALENMERALVVYDKTAKKGDDKEIEAAAEDVVKKLRGVGAAHTDPKVKKEWNNKADDFEQTRSHIIKPNREPGFGLGDWCPSSSGRSGFYRGWSPIWSGVGLQGAS